MYDEITKESELHYFMFDLPSAGQVKFDTTFYMQYLGIQILDANDNVVTGESYTWVKAAGKGVGSTEYELDKGTYYLKIVGNYYSTSTSSNKYGKYNFTRSFSSAKVNHKEPNNSPDLAANVTFGKTINGHIAKNNQLDYYKIKMASAGKITIKVNSYLEFLSFQMLDTKYKNAYLFGDRVSWIAAAKKGTKTLTFDLKKGTYILKVNGNYYGSSNSSNKFG